jgi:hypothetical protein
VKALRETYPNAELEVIENAGHLVMPEQPDAFAAVLIPFLDGAERASPRARTMESGVAYQQR